MKNNAGGRMSCDRWLLIWNSFLCTLLPTTPTSFCQSTHPLLSLFSFPNRMLLFFSFTAKEEEKKEEKKEESEESDDDMGFGLFD